MELAAFILSMLGWQIREQYRLIRIDVFGEGRAVLEGIDDLETARRYQVINDGTFVERVVFFKRRIPNVKSK